MNWGIQLRRGKGKSSVQTFKLDTRRQLMTRLMIVSFIITTVKLRKSLMIFRAEMKKFNILDLGSRFLSGAITGYPTTTTEATLESAAKLGGFLESWWIQNPLESKESGLCKICRHISFEDLLHKTDGLMHDSIPLGTLQEIMRKTECSFCRLVAHTGPQLLQGTTEILRPHESDVYCELCGDNMWNRYVTRIRLLCLKLTISSPSEYEQIIRRGNIQQILTSGEHPPEQSRNDSRLVKDQIDLELIKCWLEICRVQHRSTDLKSNVISGSLIPTTPTDIHGRSTLIIQPCQSTAMNTITPDLTLIDVKRKCLVDMPLNTAYLALSYV